MLIPTLLCLFILLFGTLCGWMLNNAYAHEKGSPERRGSLVMAGLFGAADLFLLYLLTVLV